MGSDNKKITGFQHIALSQNFLGQLNYFILYGGHDEEIAIPG